MGSSNGRPRPLVVCCRNTEGLSWDGQGEMPNWLRRAVNAGQSVELFRVG
jgi:DNA-binding protein H-NS